MKIRILWRRRRELVYPIPPAPRTAVLVEGFRSSGSVRVFNEGWGVEAASFAPAAIAANPAQIEEICSLPVPSLTHAVIALVRVDEPRLTAELRERVWSAFRVPVFEQIISESCELLAFECEAHNGLHVSSDRLALEGEIETEPCGCGRTSPRLAQPTWTIVRRIAAYAR